MYFHLTVLGKCLQLNLQNYHHLQILALVLWMLYWTMQKHQSWLCLQLLFSTCRSLAFDLGCLWTTLCYLLWDLFIIGSACCGFCS